MDNGSLKAFSMWAREKLTKSVKDKLKLLNIEDPCMADDIACTWFIRVIALRYMEVNKYLPRELSFAEIKETPDIILRQCEELKDIIPYIFKDENEYVQKCIPVDLLVDESILEKLANDIEESAFINNVEIIGWLYQYYMAEEKDSVFDGLKKNIKISKSNIPAATQIFTPRWIVQYMAQNSLGRFYLENLSMSDNKHRVSDELKHKWIYYIEEAKKEIDINSNQFKKLLPEEVRVLEPCMGAGHILTYLFDLFYDIYLSEGYKENEISRLILENNLYGLDIDERAKKLASFALIMKGREYDNNFLESISEKPLNLNLYSISESNNISRDEYDYLISKSLNTEFINDLNYILSVFEDGKEYGSMIKVKEIDFEKLENGLKIICESNEECKEIINEKIYPLISQCKVMSAKYHICITNPPFMGLRGVNDNLASYLSSNYPLSKHDTCTVFMEVCEEFLMDNGIYSIINQHSWMFLSSFIEFRKKLLAEGSFINMLHLGVGAFEENVGTIVQNVAFTRRKGKEASYTTRIIDCTENAETSIKRNLVKIIGEGNYKNPKLFEIDLNKLSIIPRHPFAYWVSDNILNIFRKSIPFEAIAKPRQGLATSDNKRFLRYWYEVDSDHICFNARNKEEALKSNKKWFPYNKGGEYRKWFGNNLFLINWENDGKEVKDYAASLYKSYSRTIKNEDFYFKSGLTYTFISQDMGVRHSQSGFIFDVAGSSIFMNDIKKEKVILAFMCSKLSKLFIDIMNPTYNIQVGDLKNIPINEEIFKSENMNRIDYLVDENIKLSMDEWNSYETSWDFKTHPFILSKEKQPCYTIEDSFNIWKNTSTHRFYKIKENEEEINEILIKIYGLKSELSSEIEEKNITVRKADKAIDVKSFISYAIGCIFERYSIDSKGFICKNNVIPVTEDICFEDDIISRFIDFVRTTYGENTLEDNLKFIANSIGIRSRESSRETIRRYIFKEFYKDHLKTYNNKPIYWLFSSGKNGGFKALCYYHKFSKETLDEVKILLDKTISYHQEKYDKVTKLIRNDTLSVKDITSLQKDLKAIENKIIECNEYNLVLGKFVSEKVNLNLDDGVDFNYKLLSELLNKR